MDKPLIGWKPLSDSRRVASARIRCHSPLRLLQASDFPVERYRHENERHYRVVVLQKLYDAEHLELARRVKRHGGRVVFDLCDNHLYNPQNDPTYRAQADLLREMLHTADIVTVPTPTLAEMLPCPATIVRDGVDPYIPRLSWNALVRRCTRTLGRCLELVWFGIGGGKRAPCGMQDLALITDQLNSLAQDYPVRLTVISDSYDAFREHVQPLPFSTRYNNWRSHENLCNRLPQHDLCLIPINRNPYTITKSANRLALSLFLGVPVVATSIPSYEEFRAFCALDHWSNSLRQFAEDPARSRAQAETGRQYVLGHHMLEHSAAEWKRVLEEVLASS